MSNMSNYHRLAVIFCTLLLGACTATGPADDGYDNSNEWTDTGTLLSDDARTVYSTEEVATPATSEPEQTSTIALSEKAEFEKFKQWEQLRTEGAESAEYREFLQWLKFQELKATQ